jgi:recombination protein RecA
MPRGKAKKKKKRLVKAPKVTSSTSKSINASMIDAVVKSVEGSLKRDIRSTPDDFPIFFIDTGSYALNWAVSGRPLSGGYPGGRVTEIFGDPSTGKSIAIYKAISVVQALGGVAILDDTERAFMEPYAVWFGIDISRVIFLQSDQIDQHFDDCIAIVTKLRAKHGYNFPILVALDSLGQLMSDREAEKGFSKEDTGRKAVLIRKGMRMIVPLLKVDPRLVWLIASHKMTLFGDFFKDSDSTGGKGVKFQASVRIDLEERGREKHPDKDSRYIGVNSSANVVKNKVVTPYRRVWIQILWHLGIQQEYGLYKLMEDEDILIPASRKGYRYLVEDDVDREFTEKEFMASDDLKTRALNLLETKEKLIIKTKPSQSSEPSEEEKVEESQDVESTEDNQEQE